MRRLPVYFLIDVSESMVGKPVEEVENGMRTIIQELQTDPYALETVFVSIIAFAGKAKVLAPLNELYKFYPPKFPIGSGTSLGKGLEALMDDIDKSVQKTTQDVKGDWKPIIFLFTDGTPTDNYDAAFKRWNDKYRRHCNLVAISIGDNMNTQILGKITDNVLMLKKTDAATFKQFFKWITASIKCTSASVSQQNSDDIKLAPTDGINLEKVNPHAQVRVDENYAVFLGKCQTTGKLYLLKYARRIGNIEDMESLLTDKFNFVGGYTIDEKSYNELSDGKPSCKSINTNRLYGHATCPACGNSYGMVICDCDNIFCAGENSNDHCPWCGAQGELSAVGSDGIDIKRTKG